MSMKALYNLRDMLCDELDDIARKGEMGTGDLEIVHKLTDTIKNIDKICLMDENGGYSQAGDWEAMGRGRFGDYSREYNDGGNSYANRGEHYVRGHYSRADGRGRGGRGGRVGYSRDGGEDMMEHIDKMMEEAETPEEREVIKRFKKEIKKIYE